MNKRFLGLIIAVTFSLLMTVLSTSCNTKPMTISKAVDRDKECLCEISNEYFLGQIDALENALLAMIQIDSSIVDFETVKKEIDEYREKVLNLTEIPNNIVEDFSILQKELLLKNPKFKFSDVLCRETKNGSMPANWVGNSEIDKTGYGNRIISFKFQNSLKEKEIYKPKGSSAFVGDIVPSFNGEKFLYSSISDKKNWEVFEFDLITEQERQVSTETFSDIDNYNGCYLPDDRIIYCSTATMVGVPCVGGVDYVANLYIMDNNGENIRQLTYEQDADWYPTVMNSGKIMYLRWEYTDLAHYFTRIMMSMNPDGTAQKALYGTNSYWPNSMFYSKPLPGNDRRFVSIVTGHHGTERAGELILFDTSLGEKEAEGAVMRLGAVTKDVNPAIMDELVEKIWPKYLHPYPLTDNSFLVASKTGPKSNWAIYLVDTYGNRVLIKEKKNLHLLEPVPIMSREVPPIIPDKVDLTKKDAVVYLQDIYKGDGLKGIPKGTVKQLRLFTYGYTLRNFGSHDRIGVESGWDGKILLGTVDVEKDGSSTFKIPSNIPISIQPLDKDGCAIQLMRSWMTAMPGEYISCIGCHEESTETPHYGRTLASFKEPQPVEPVFSQPVGIGYEQEIQPILDQNCISCHNGLNGKPNFKDRDKIGWFRFSKSYHNLHGYIRRPGPESDLAMLKPMEFHASTSELIQMLDAGHHGVRLDSLSRRRLVRWIDMNVPYYPNYNKVFNDKDYVKVDAKAKRIREKFNSYAIDTEIDPATVDRIENEKRANRYSNFSNNYNREKFVSSLKKEVVSKKPTISCDKKLKTITLFVDKEKLELKSVFSDSIYVLTKEVTNKLYSYFDSTHDSRYFDQQSKDHVRQGYPANGANQPVVRINWYEATLFCEWLSELTGKNIRLLEEDEWKKACLAGSTSEFSYGKSGKLFSLYANLADKTIVNFAVTGIDPKPTTPTIYNDFIPRCNFSNDNYMVSSPVGTYLPNKLGLYDMHGNVSEWVGTKESDRVIAKGGSWRDRPKRAGVNAQQIYKPYQKVFNVGFRFCLEE